MTSPSNAPASFAFQYEAQTPTGVALRGTIEAPTVSAAQAKLAALNLRVLSVGPAPAAARSKAPLGTDDFLLFNQQLAQLTQAGLPVERGLRLIAEDLHSGRLSAAAELVAGDLESGLSLHDAFARHANRFPPLYARLVDAGVQTGNLPGMLFGLGRHLELVSRLRQTLWRTLAYPAVVFATFAAILYLIATWVLPQFEDIFRDFRTTLPTLTMFVIFLGRIYPYLALVLILVVGVVIATLLTLRFNGQLPYVVDHVLLRIPLVGRVLRAGLLARWCDALRLGVLSGLDLPRALALASDATASPRLMRDAASLSELLASGASLREFHADILPATIPAAIELSANSGDLPATLATVSRMYEQQAEQRLRLIPVAITPLFMIIVAGAIGFTITAMFLPLVRLISSLSGGGSEGG